MEDDKDLLNIQLRVANGRFPMSIRREDEKVYREAAVRIDNLLNEYRKKFPGLTMETYMTMVAVDLAEKTVRLENKNDVRPYKQKLEELTRTLEGYLTENTDK